jgi:N-methylhydantoinase B
VLETKSPMFIQSYGYRPDTGGAGLYRGGVGVGRSYRFTAPSSGICLVYKTKTKPWAIEGGLEGDNNHVILNPGTDREVVQGGSYNHLAAGDVLVNNTGGGGGYGNPMLRDPSAVARDVRNGFVSVLAAERDYGVLIDPLTFKVDDTKTASRREALQ